MTTTRSLKYGMNPNQKNASLSMAGGQDLPFEVLCGNPGYINFLDALNAWQLVRELRDVLGLPAATSFKHVSPTSAAIGLPLDNALKRACFLEDVDSLDASPLACAFARARGTDRMSSFGDFIALSEICDAPTALLIRHEVSDGVIAPGYEPEALALLKEKKQGSYNIIQIDPNYRPTGPQQRTVFGVTFTQEPNDARIDEDFLGEIVTGDSPLPEEARRDLIVALTTLKYTQSNSVCYAYDGQAIGVGAGQQSRIHCTRLAGDKADTWFLRRHEKVLDLPFRADLPRVEKDNAIDRYLHDTEMDILADGIWQRFFETRPERMTEQEKRAHLDQIQNVALGSDAFFPFSDNIERAAMSGVRYISQPGGSRRDEEVIEGCARHGITMTFCRSRLFHH